MLLQLLQCLRTIEASTVISTTTALSLLLSLVVTAVIQTGDISTTRRKLRHLRKHGLTASNMADQYDPKYDVPEGTAPTEPIRIKALYIHPVKSCGPIEVHRALLTKIGFLYDRCFAFATEVPDGDAATGSKWRFLSQRTKPIMSQIKTELWLPHEQSDAHDPLVQAGGCVVLTFQDPEPPSWTTRLEAIFHTWDLSAKPQVTLIAPLHPTPEQQTRFNIRLRTFGIHSRAAEGLDMGAVPSVAAALPKLKTLLGIPASQPLTLLRCTPDTLTRTDRNLAPLAHIGTPSLHGYTDQQPVHINSVSSVHAVSAQLPSENRPLNALRFRANIWFTGAPAYDEESWKRFRIVPRDGAEPRAAVAPTLSVVCRTSRCTMPNVDPDTGVFDAENPAPGKKKGRPQPSTTLVRYRTVEDGNPAALGYLGMHCVPEDRALDEARAQGEGVYIAVGDEIEMLERGVHLYGSTGNDY